MNRLKFPVLALLCANALASIQPEDLQPDTCVSAQACLDRVFELAESWPDYRGGWPYPPDVVELGMRIAELDAELTDDLVALLHHQDRYVAQVAGLALSEQPSIDPRFFGDILQAVEMGVRFSGGPLGRVDSTEAAELVVQRLVGGENGNRTAYQWAAALQGARAVPFIVEAARCHDPCREERHRLLADVLERMGPERSEAGPGLLSVAADEVLPEHARVGALAMIAELGPGAVELDDGLVSLRHANPHLKAPINGALIKLRSDEAGEIFAERLSNSPNRRDMVRLAGMRRAGYAAGPVVEALLSHADWDIRLQAVRTLALIGFDPAVDSITPLLTSRKDVALNWMAADAMAHLNAVESIDALQQLAETHWHPHVRARAARSRDRLLGLSAFEPLSRLWPSARVAYSQEPDSMAGCDEPGVGVVRPSSPARIQHPDDEALLRMLSYSSEFAGDATVRRHDQPLVPGLALRVDGGWLTGSDRGEWGGELVFIDRSGRARVLVRENVQDIHRLGRDKYIAVTGLGHMLTSRGMLYRVQKTPGESWAAERWRRLPGAPVSSALTQGGDVLVSTRRGGSVLVSPDGQVRMAPCRRPSSVQ
ncbi:MAG: hypothetical protein GVY11_02425 [Gammaproteobacteria bacterium]|nr:hypothetical protein [Gammaproteobacteria bacterium]